MPGTVVVEKESLSVIVVRLPPELEEIVDVLIEEAERAEVLRLAANAWSFFFLDGLCTGRKRNNKYNHR